uniref:Disease resistance R13L4/SHOC-2-like LRR domain-containing protein n=1 Tax=Leersia perrieri TaxID=77586 RepID=A0A0D9WHR2_9ORYZ
MKNLRKVKIWFKHFSGNNNYISDLSQAIEEFTKAPIDRDIDRSLSLDSSSEECPENILSSLDLQTCSEGSKYALRSLKLNGKLHQLPPFVSLLSGLIELCISSATLTQVHLSALINLNRLLYLKLVASKLENFEIKHGAFPSLRRLCFVVKSATSALPIIKHGALPNLISLQLLCQCLVGLSGIEIRHMKHLKEITVNSGVSVQWEQAAKKHPNRPKVLFLRKVDPMESEKMGKPCVIREQIKISVAQLTNPEPSSGLDSSLNKIRLSKPPSSRLQKVWNCAK